MEFKCDVAVVGGGHAGCEAALASARLGLETVLFTISIEHIALMPCNPSVGGPAKGHIVREIDALGGEMGRNVDRSSIQTRVLNTKKGPAVHALRSQCDKDRYHQNMLHTLMNQPNLKIKQAIVNDLLVEDGVLKGLRTHTGLTYLCRAVVINSGTYLESRVIVGESAYAGGPYGQVGAYGLSAALVRSGIEIARFKTGTPPRVNSDSLDFDEMIIQPGDEERRTFSYDGIINDLPQLPCWLTFTNEEAHAVIRANIHRSPLYAGMIEGRGPRYCPCIEDKVMRYSHKEKHQLFLEPMGMDTKEYYVGGLSTSMPEDVQYAVLRAIPGMRHVDIIRPGYSVEYDYVIPTQLKNTLETKKVRGLFTAGQTNGTSGYEEAAAQGLLAGINAAMYVLSREPLVLSRDQAYIGVLVDDLIVKGVFEPYRMMTSRAEYRLLLRNDNADARLTEKGRSCGLVDDIRYTAFKNKMERLSMERGRLASTLLTPTAVLREAMQAAGLEPISRPQTAGELLKRPELDYFKVTGLSGLEAVLSREEAVEVELEIKYEGYLKKQEEQIERSRKMEERSIDPAFDYHAISGLTLEAREKLSLIRPVSLGQAGRISGVSPADIAVLMVHLDRKKRRKETDITND